MRHNVSPRVTVYCTLVEELAGACATCGTGVLVGAGTLLWALLVCELLSDDELLEDELAPDEEDEDDEVELALVAVGTGVFVGGISVGVAVATTTALVCSRES